MTGGPTGRPLDGGADEPDVPVDGPETVAENRLLASFGRRARAANLDRVARLVALLDAAQAQTLDDRGRLEAESVAHQVVGSAGTFGWPVASVLAAQVEAFFAEDGHDDAAETRRALDELAVRLRD